MKRRSDKFSDSTVLRDSVNSVPLMDQTDRKNPNPNTDKEINVKNNKSGTGNESQSASATTFEQHLRDHRNSTKKRVQFANGLQPTNRGFPSDWDWSAGGERKRRKKKKRREEKRSSQKQEGKKIEKTEECTRPRWRRIVCTRWRETEDMKQEWKPW